MPTNGGDPLPGEEEAQIVPAMMEAGTIWATVGEVRDAWGNYLRNAGGVIHIPAGNYQIVPGGWNMQAWPGPGYTAEAEQAAEHALRRALTPQQASTWARRQWFTLRSNLGHWWRIRGRGVSGNVDLLSSEHGVPLAAFCAHPAGTMPYAAYWLSQLLTLTHDEARFTKVAIWHYGYDVPDGLQVAPDVLALLPPNWAETR